MSASTMSHLPAQLSVAEIDAMSQRQIKKHHVAIILLHWFNAIVWLLELSTGVALISSPYFRVAPSWYLQIVEGIFGTRANMLHFHIALGLIWAIVFIVYGTFGFRTYLRKEVLQKEIALDRDDVRWLLVRVGNMIRSTKDPLPPQGVYNAGQKLFAILVYMMVPLVMITRRDHELSSDQHDRCRVGGGDSFLRCRHGGVGADDPRLYGRRVS